MARSSRRSCLSIVGTGFTLNTTSTVTFSMNYKTQSYIDSFAVNRRFSLRYSRRTPGLITGTIHSRDKLQMIPYLLLVRWSGFLVHGGNFWTIF